MEQWKVETLNKCAKTGNLPKGFPFNKEQITSILDINPAEFILLQKENFISRTADISDNFNTTDRWDKLKNLGSFDALLAQENKDNPVVASAPVAESKKEEKPKTAAPVAEVEKKATPAPVQNTHTAGATPASAGTPVAPVKEKVVPAKPTEKMPAPVAVAKEGMDMVTIISLIGAAIGIIIVVYSMVKK